mmetsp:Transcript_33439/g.107457  ORF Transcript_33439/g.107457 Transcript_33439/m.107457 type:complete len:214 (+) Transcript_33439:1308-1949(+)
MRAGPLPRRAARGLDRHPVDAQVEVAAVGHREGLDKDVRQRRRRLTARGEGLQLALGRGELLGRKRHAQHALVILRRADGIAALGLCGGRLGEHRQPAASAVADDENLVEPSQVRAEVDRRPDGAKPGGREPDRADARLAAGRDEVQLWRRLLRRPAERPAILPLVRRPLGQPEGRVVHRGNLDRLHGVPVAALEYPLLLLRLRLLRLLLRRQ